MLYRMTTAALPFTGTDPLSVLLAVTSDQPEPPSKLNSAIPAALSDLIMRLLAKDPKDRPASARAVVETIEVIERRLATAAVPLAKAMEPSRNPVSPRNRVAMLVAVAAGVLFLVLIVAGIMVFRITTDKGTVVIETDDPDVEVVVKQGGKQVKIVDVITKQEI